MNNENNEFTLEDLNQSEAQGQQEANNKLQVKDRFAKLSEKITLEAKARADAEAREKAANDAKAQAEKQRDFYRDFSKLSSQFPAAADFQDKILEKVNSGYSTEDATYAVLAREGKLGGTAQPITQATKPVNVAGGSSATTMPSVGEKAPEEMTREEMRSALLNAEKEGANLLKF